MLVLLLNLFWLGNLSSRLFTLHSPIKQTQTNQTINFKFTIKVQCMAYNGDQKAVQLFPLISIYTVYQNAPPLFKISFSVWLLNTMRLSEWQRRFIRDKIIPKQDYVCLRLYL